MTMQFFSAARRPANEAERQAEVDRYPEEAFRSPRINELVAEAQTLVGTSIAALSIIDGDRQRLFAVQGADLMETPRAVAVCAHAILTPDDVTCIPDLDEDGRFQINPLIAAHGWRFYAGAPVVADNGLPLGALCTIDPRRLNRVSAAVAERLKTIADEIAAELAGSRR